MAQATHIALFALGKDIDGELALSYEDAIARIRRRAASWDRDTEIDIANASLQDLSDYYADGCEDDWVNIADIFLPYNIPGLELCVVEGSHPATKPTSWEQAEDANVV